jgi:hypothetical protein
MILTGLLFFSSLVSQLTMFMNNLRAIHESWFKNSSYLRRYLRHKRINRELSQRIMRFCEHAHEEEQRLLPASRVVYLNYISKGLRRELAEALVKKSFLSQECLNQVGDCDALLTRSLCCLACTAHQHAPEEVIFAAGARAEGIYVLKAGSFAYASGVETLSFPHVHERKKALDNPMEQVKKKLRSTISSTMNASLKTSSGRRNDMNRSMKEKSEKDLDEWNDEEHEIVMAEMSLISTSEINWRHQGMLRSVRMSETVTVSKRGVNSCLEVYPEILAYYKLTCQIRESLILGTYRVPQSGFDLEESARELRRIRKKTIQNGKVARTTGQADLRPMLVDYVDERLIKETRLRGDSVDPQILVKLEEAVGQMNKRGHLRRGFTTEQLPSKKTKPRDSAKEATSPQPNSPNSRR